MITGDTVCASIPKQVIASDDWTWDVIAVQVITPAPRTSACYTHDGRVQFIPTPWLHETVEEAERYFVDHDVREEVARFDSPDTPTPVEE